MKKLILFDHQGNKLLEQEVFVEGQDFRWQSLKPTAFWLGEICLVDKEPDEVEKVKYEAAVQVEQDAAYEEVIPDEPTEIDNKDTGDRGASSASELEGAERLPEQPAGGEPSKRSKRAGKRKAA